MIVSTIKEEESPVQTVSPFKLKTDTIGIRIEKEILVSGQALGTPKLKALKV